MGKLIWSIFRKRAWLMLKLCCYMMWLIPGRVDNYLAKLVQWRAVGDKCMYWKLFKISFKVFFNCWMKLILKIRSYFIDGNVLNSFVSITSFHLEELNGCFSLWWLPEKKKRIKVNKIKIKASKTLHRFKLMYIYEFLNNKKIWKLKQQVSDKK